MEKELFAKSNVHELNLVESEESSARSNLAHLPKDVLRSGTIETLISQNEDLQARLKVLLRRLAQLEDENYKLGQETRESRNHYSSLADQILILREKDEIWKKRTLRAEEELEKNKSNTKLREIEFAELRADLLQQKKSIESHLTDLNSDVQRLRRYRMRAYRVARTMINQLNDRNSFLDKSCQALQVKVDALQSQIHSTTQQTELIVRNAKIQIANLEDEKRALIGSFEKERDDLKLELRGLEDITSELRKKTSILDRTLDRQDYLENRVVTLERQKEDTKVKFDRDIVELQGQLVEWRRRAHEAEAQKLNLEGLSQENENRAMNYQELAQRLQIQLDGLRTLWTETTTEVERLRSSNQALEKLNAELCLKLNESRNTTL